MNARIERSGEQGFTLMEIMVVVAILALIIGAVAVNIGGANKQAKVSVTKTALSSLDSALERFKLDFNAYPTAVLAVDGPQENADPDTQQAGVEGNWTKVSKALSSAGLVGDKLYQEELRFVLETGLGMDLGDNIRVNELQQSFTGPYIKSRTGVVYDGFKRPFILIVDNQQGLYKLYSKGENGRNDIDLPLDDVKKDDLVSEGSQLDSQTN